jgi:DNA-binding transcriptional ArsR family regulator
MTIAKRSPTPSQRLPIEQPVLERAARVVKVVGHPLRLRILEALEDGERHVAEIQAGTGSSQAAVSQQLGILRAHGIVDARRDGLRVYYRIVEPRVIKILDCIRECDLPELAALDTLVPLGDLARVVPAGGFGSGDKGDGRPKGGRRSRSTPRP